MTLKQQTKGSWNENAAFNGFCQQCAILAACGNDSNDQQFSNPETNADLNQIKNPVVTTTAYSQDNMPAVSADSRLMTYKMLGVDGKVVQATALVFTPKTVAPAGGWKIVAWAHGTTGVADKCAPSRKGLQGMNTYCKCYWQRVMSLWHPIMRD
nr:hypothetical protein [Acinetobacter sp. YH12140]